MSGKRNELLTRAQTAQDLGVCLRSIDNYVRQGHLKCVRRALVGRRVGVFFERAELERFRKDVQALLQPQAAGE